MRTSFFRPNLAFTFSATATSEARDQKLVEALLCGDQSGAAIVYATLQKTTLVVATMLQLFDFAGNIRRHVVAPRAKTQEGMNLCMRGTKTYLGERYASMTLYLYLMMWYCSIYPGAFWMGSIGLMIMYVVDRFCLMRTWSRSPALGLAADMAASPSPTLRLPLRVLQGSAGARELSLWRVWTDHAVHEVLTVS